MRHMPRARAMAVALSTLLAVAASPALARPPRLDEPVPSRPAPLARALAGTSAGLDDAVGRWRAVGDPAAGGPPREVLLHALYQQRILRALARRPPPWAAAVLARLPAPLASRARDVTIARRGLERITPLETRRRLRVGPPLPADVLLGHYREAERRFRVPWTVLAAVNFVESAFGRVQSASSAGAQGPMQFLPATWRAYGLGGDVHDPHDAILGAANYLRASGAPGDISGALYAYNRSESYVDAVLRYARHMRADVHAYYGYYSWQAFMRTPAGDVRLTGPGHD
jgi:membrane-bound lytic murein transglycosylase B